MRHFVDGGDVQRGDIAIFVDDHALGLRGRHVQWAGSYVVDGAFGQMVGFAHFVDGFRRQSNDRVRSKQLSCHHWIEVVLTYVHPVDLDALGTGLERGIDPVVDHKGHRVLHVMACDLFGDVVRQGDDLGDILGFGAQLDETGASVEGLGHDVENRPVAAIVGADHEIEAQVETVAHGWVWERVHCVT